MSDTRLKFWTVRKRAPSESRKPEARVLFPAFCTEEIIRVNL